MPQSLLPIFALFEYDKISFAIVATAILVNVSCALLGCFLLLRRMSLLGDAISHAILPGLALGFMLTQSRAIWPMLAGAMFVGVLTALLTQVLTRWARVPEDAAMGVVFTSLFAIGVIMIHRVARQVDLDASCVLYGMLETAAMDTTTVAGVTLPRTVLTMGIVCALVILFVVLLWKELKIVSFDPDLATTQGINANVIHYLLMSMVAAVTVAAFEAVGSILVVAMLIAPAAAASMLTDRMSIMLLIAALCGIASAVIGREIAYPLGASVPGMMSVVAGAIFTLAVIFGPSHGLLIKALRRWKLSLRIVREDVLSMLYRWDEISPERALQRSQAQAALGGGLLPRFAIWDLLRDGRIKREADGVALTERGRRQAQTLVKSHRLWEAYLQKVLGFPADHLHASADRTEHFMNEGLVRQVADAVDNPRIDPHGKPIPRREGSRVDLGEKE